MTGTTAQILFNSIIPEQYRDYRRNYSDPEVIPSLLEKMARELPSKQYRDILRNIYKLGADVSYYEGAGFKLKDFETPDAVKQERDKLRQDVQKIAARKDLTKEKRNDLIVKTVSGRLDHLKKLMMDEASASDSGLARQIKSKSRGKVEDLQSLLLGDALMQDSVGNVIPFPMLRSYSEGVSPAEYFAGAHGTRQGMISTKLCVSEGTLVRMADGGEKAIEDICVGDYVVGSDIRGNSVRTKVTAVFDNGVQPVNEYVFRINGSRQTTTVQCTDTHKLLTTFHGHNTYAINHVPTVRPMSSAGPARKKSSKFVAYPVSGTSDSWQEGRREPRAMFLGLMIGDGCVRQSGYQFSCADPLLIREAEPYFKVAGFTLRHATGYGFSVCSTETHKFDRSPDGRILGSGHPTKAWMKELGLHGKYAWEKHLPDDVWSWDNQSIAEIIGGIYSSDGCISRAGSVLSVRLVLTSKKLITQIHDLLNYRFGVATNPIGRVSIRDNMKHVQWGLGFSLKSSLFNFYQNIPLVGKKRVQFEDEIRRVEFGKVREKRPGFRLQHATPIGERQTYDLEVEHPDHLYVLANGIITSNSTADTGYWAKKAKQVSHRQVVTEDDCGTAAHIQADTNDADNIGSILSVDTDGIPAGTPLTPTLLKKIKSPVISVRSPMTCRAEGGLCAKCVGIRDTGKLADIGDNVGMPAAQALGEKATQTALSKKHSSGRTSGKKAPFVSGFKLIEQLLDVPANFKDSAAMSDVDGLVEKIEDAPQGGQFIFVGDRKYHLAENMESLVKPGDEVEAGDILSTGIPDPSKLVRHKGIGEARRLFAKQMREATGSHRRNAEILSKGFIDYVRVTDPEAFPNRSPDDVIRYSEIEKRWEPRKNTRHVSPGSAIGKYLEVPTAHYSIGTRISKKVAADLAKRGFKQIDANDDAPPFEPVTVPSARALTKSDDWQERMGGYYLKDSLLDAASRGATSEMKNISYLPGLMKGTDFGSTLSTEGKY